MSKKSFIQKQNGKEGERSFPVPPGAPAWVTSELLAHTHRVWQPFYKMELIPEDLLEIITNTGRLVDVLSSGEKNEEVRRISPSQ